MQSAPTKIILFDVCHMDVAVRAILWVQMGTAIATLLLKSPLSDWLMQYALLLGATLPSTVAWLATVCLAKPMLQRMVPSIQWSMCLLLGFLCGIVSCALFAWMADSAPVRQQWIGAGFAGSAYAGVLMALLVWRQKATQPADMIAKLAELQSRIRPHFLFNTLNSAIALIQDDPKKAELILEDLSDLFHHALKDPNSASTLEKEITIAKQYLAIEQIRFEDRLRVHWHLSGAVLDAQLPPLILQPLVENAIKHGIEPSADGGDVHIWVRQKGQKAFIRISNSLPSRQSAKVLTTGNGIALKNIRHRLRLMHESQAFFATREKPDSFEVDLIVPIPAIHAEHATAFTSTRISPSHDYFGHR